MSKLDCIFNYENDCCIDVKQARMSLHSIECDTWKYSVMGFPKLRAYIQYKYSCLFVGYTFYFFHENWVPSSQFSVQTYPNG